MYYCAECDKYCKTENGYNMHMENSAAHQELDYECDFCDRWFGTEQARHQHYAAAANHPYCVDCERTFNSENSLTQVSQIEHETAFNTDYQTALALQNSHGD